MSELRDARFRQALDHAPDAHERPAPATRSAIARMAREAVQAAQPVQTLPWWRALWPSSGERMPWNAAFATIAVATLVTVLWHDKEVPDARVDRAAPVAVPAAAPASAVAPAAPVVPAPTASARATPAHVARAPAQKQTQTQTSVPAPATPPPAPAAPPPAAAPAPPPAAAPRAEARERADAAATGPLQDRASSDFAKAAPPPPSVPVMQPAAPSAAMQRSAPSPRLATPSAAALGEASGRAGAQSMPFMFDAVTQVRVTIAARTVDAPLQKPSRLADLLGRIAREPRNAEPLAAQAEQRIELYAGAELIVVLELAGPQARWEARAPLGGPSGTSRPGAALLQDLRDELARMTR